ncbi:MAG: mitochondrial fission ELM1 family protein [Akkermansiaceae bacterium]|jgi:hypothetical protein|nr:mitochondrial fission ELM1 family protein [Akkermansiaceae bacterium]
MTRPLSLLVLTDGKPGHQNQSLGLAEAIQRRCAARIRTLALPGGKFSSLARLPTPDPLPDLILGAGHRTHAGLLQLSRRTGVPCVVLMKPSLPTALFDLCLIPEHDLGSRPVAAHVIPTRGALNRLPPPAPDQRREQGLILIGGPSNSHGWEQGKIRECLQTITRTRSEIPWKITDSRRTPAGGLEDFLAHMPDLQAFPHAQTAADWLPTELAASREVWVTEDSVSMIYEALSSGAGVGLLPVPAKRGPSRVSRGILRLIDDSWVTPFDRWSPGKPLPAPPAILREADRCAGIVLERFFPSRS